MRGDDLSRREREERFESLRSIGTQTGIEGKSMAGKSDEKAPRDEGLGLRMLKTRTVLVSGAVDDKLAERTIEKLLILEAENHDPIRVLITSQGGHVDSGMAIHDMLRFIESPVVTIGTG
jgi:ATP-dependent protease ClpP protease subunit